MAISVGRSSALCAFFAATALALGACGGDDVPDNGVAKIDGEVISNTDFAHWMAIANASQQQQAGVASQLAVPDAPNYATCIADTRKATKTAKGQPTPTDASLKDQCKSRYEGLRSQVMNFLILSRWVDGEAADQSVTATKAAVDKEFTTRKKQSFKTEKAYKAFLDSTKQTEADLKEQIRLELLQTKLQAKIVGTKNEITDKAVADYYKKNKSKFAQPERRDIRIVLAKTDARAKAAKAALEAGAGWKTVAKRFSIDEATKNVGGVLLAVTKGSQEQKLDDAVFKASKGKLLGPIKTQFGSYVFVVDKVTPATQQTQDQAKAVIEQTLRQEQQESAVNTFSEDFRKKWTSKTACRSGYAVELCDNAPKTTATTAPATTTPTTTG